MKNKPANIGTTADIVQAAFELVYYTYAFRKRGYFTKAEQTLIDAVENHTGISMYQYANKQAVAGVLKQYSQM